MNILNMFKTMKLDPETSSSSTKMTISGDEITDSSKINDPVIKFNRPRYHSRNAFNNFKKRYNDVSFYKPEYDLPTIANAIQLDGLLNRAKNVYVEQILKNHYDIISINDRAQLHTTKRLREIELSTGISFHSIISAVSDQLVTYGNAYILKIRKHNSKFGRKYKKYNKTLNPVLGLFVADATTMEIGLTSDGKIVQYKQTVCGDERYYNVEDVIHIPYNRIPGTLSGLSNFHMVIDDVRALRKLEEEMEILGYQYAIPLYLYTVGTDNHPAAPGEVDLVSNEVNHMPSYGIVVAPHTHDIKAVTNSNDPVDIMKFVEHFKRRIYSGLGVSPVAMGETETSNRNTSEVSELSMQSTTKMFQKIIQSKIDKELLDEILLDGGFNPLDVMINLRFPEIDLEAQIKKETHIIQMYHSQLISRTEARLESGREGHIDEKDTYLYGVQVTLAEEQAKTAAKYQPPTVKDVSKANKSIENKVKADNNPSNQHGKQVGRPKIVKDLVDDITEYASGLTDVLLLDNAYTSELNRQSFVTKLKNKAELFLNDYITKSFVVISKQLQINNITLSDDFKNELKHKMMLNIDEKIKRFKKIESNDHANIKINYTINSLMDDITNCDIIDNALKLYLLDEEGHAIVKIDSSNCPIHNDNDPITVSVNDLNLTNIPPYSNGCLCEIKGYNE